MPSLQISSQLCAVISAASGLGLQQVIGRGDLVVTIFNHALRRNYLEAVRLVVSYKYLRLNSINSLVFPRLLPAM